MSDRPPLSPPPPPAATDSDTTYTCQSLQKKTDIYFMYTNSQLSYELSLQLSLFNSKDSQPIRDGLGILCKKAITKKFKRASKHEAFKNKVEELPVAGAGGVDVDANVERLAGSDVLSGPVTVWCGGGKRALKTRGGGGGEGRKAREKKVTTPRRKREGVRAIAQKKRHQHTLLLFMACQYIEFIINEAQRTATTKHTP